MGPGHVHLASPSISYGTDLHDASFTLLRIPWEVAGELAEKQTGLPAEALRFHSMTPVSGPAAAMATQTVMLTSQLGAASTSTMGLSVFDVGFVRQF